MSFPTSVNLASWAGGLHPARPLWVSHSREPHGVGSESAAASDSGSEEAGHLPQDCMIL